MNSLSKNIHSICIIRLSSIGDVTHVIPVILSAQEQLPGVKITWIIGKIEARLIGDLPGVEFIIFDKNSPIKSYWALKHHLNKRRFDVLMHMQVSFRANFCSALVSAKRRIGYDKTRSSQLHRLFISQRIAPAAREHVRDCLASFLQQLGLSIAKPSWIIPLAEEDKAFAGQFLDSTRLKIIFSPCSSHKRRNWLPERYAELADYAVTQYDAQIVFVGSARSFEKNFVAQIQSHMKQAALNLVGKDTLKQLAALLAKADLLVAPDTGPTHIASAMGTDVLGLYAASNPYRSGPYNSIQWCIDRYPEALMKHLGKTTDNCQWGTKAEFAGVMALITTDDAKKMLDCWVTARPLSTSRGLSASSSDVSKSLEQPTSRRT